MNIQRFVKLLRTRWITIAVVILISVLTAVAITVMTTPKYEASTRLFVSTTSGSSLSDVYQGNRFSQERVVSYTELITGETLARRTIDKLGLDMTPEELQAKVKASAKPDTVLIDVDVLDPSPVRARDIANALSDEFVMMVRELETPEDGAKPDARVIVEQRATIPEHPVIPRTSVNLVSGLAVGLVLGLALAVLRDMLDNTVKDQQTLEQIAGAGVVGNIPLDKERRKEPAIVFEHNNTSIAEAFRKLRTNLKFLAVDNPPRVIMVTSSVPSEGKSTTTINIALALAEAEHSVVIVDGDMRRPVLHKYLELVGPVGLSTVLSGGAQLEDALQPTKFPRLTVLTSGTIPPNPSELLGSLAAEKLIGELRERFDYVIIDSSPLLAVTDAAILATKTDGVLIVARFGQTKRDQLAHAIRSLADVGVSILGAVFTITPTRGTGSYNYNYNYGNDEKESAGDAAKAPDGSIHPKHKAHTSSD